jgi:hypothetical protein
MAWKSRRRGRPAWPAVLVLSGIPAASSAAEPPVQAALRYFIHEDGPGLMTRLDAVRPSPVGSEERARVLATLPRDGEVLALSPAERARIAAARRMLELHERDAVYVVKVIEVPQAAVALHGRTVVLVSRPALGLLRADELQALVAHEIGHEYFWHEYLEARRDHDRARLQTLELLSDGLAVVTLRRAGIGHMHLLSALEKMVRYNRHRFGPALNEKDYPALGERRRFVDHLAQWLARTIE